MLLLIVQGLLVQRNGEEKDQGLCFGDKYSGSSVTTFTWSPFEARTAVTLPQPFPEVAGSTTAPWDRLLQQDETPTVKALVPLPEGGGAPCSLPAPGAGQCSVLVLQVRSWPHRGWGSASLSSLLCSKGDVGGGSVGTAVPSLAEPPSPGFKPVRQCLCSFTNSIQEFSQQRKHWHTGWLLNSFLSFFLLSFFFFNWFFFFCRLCRVMCSFI